MGLGRVDGARDMWMGPRMCGWGPGHVGGGRMCVIVVVVDEGQVVSMDTGGTRDMPVRVVHKSVSGRTWTRGDTHSGGCTQRASGWMLLGFCGQGVTADKDWPWQGEGSRRANMIGKPFALCKACAYITPLKHTNSISHANVHEPG